MALRRPSLLRSVSLSLGPLVAAALTTFSSVARADAEVAPYEPASSEPVVALSVHPTRSGEFAVFMRGARGTAFVAVRGGVGVELQPTAIGSSTVGLATAPTRDRGDAHVALLGNGGELRSFVADLSGGAFREAEGTSRTASYATAQRLSMGFTDRPVIGVSTSASLQLGDVFGPAVTVEPPGVAGPPVVASAAGEAFVLTPVAAGMTIQHVAADGRSVEAATRASSSGAVPVEVGLVPLGKGALAVMWPASRTTATTTVVPLTLSSSVTLVPGTASRMLPAGTVGLVADPEAPNGPDAKILRVEGGRLTESSWNAEAKASGPEATNTVASSTDAVSAVEGACDAKGCLYALADGLGVRTIYSPRAGASNEARISIPVTGGRSSGTSYMYDSGCSQAPGSSGGSKLAGLGVLGLALAATRRRRASSR
jgi:MYXO-CTERM domain-containing protein